MEPNWAQGRIPGRSCRLRFIGVACCLLPAADRCETTCSAKLSLCPSRLREWVRWRSETCWSKCHCHLGRVFCRTGIACLTTSPIGELFLLFFHTHTHTHHISYFSIADDVGQTDIGTQRTEEGAVMGQRATVF